MQFKGKWAPLRAVETPEIRQPIKSSSSALFQEWLFHFLPLSFQSSASPHWYVAPFIQGLEQKRPRTLTEPCVVRIVSMVMWKLSKKILDLDRAVQKDLEPWQRCVQYWWLCGNCPKFQQLLLHLSCITFQTLLLLQTARSKAENTLHNAVHIVEILLVETKFQICADFQESNGPTFPLTLTRRPLIPVTRR